MRPCTVSSRVSVKWSQEERLSAAKMIESPTVRREEFERRVLSWGSKNFMDFPWRRSTKSFEILIAEILLRKTSRKRVAVVYQKLLRAFPTPDKLSRARRTRIARLVRPLGMQRSRS